MNRTKHRYIVFFLLFLIISMITACKKKKAFKNENAQTSVDVRMFQGQNDAALSDINEAIMGQSLMRGRGTDWVETHQSVICGLDQDTSLWNLGTIKLIYNGTPCKGVVRTGTVVASILNYPSEKWKNMGASLKIDFLAYKAVWLSDGKTVQIDGTELLKNESGKTWYDLQYLNAPNLVQVLTGSNLKATYSIDNTANFDVNRRMEYSFDDATKVTSCKVDGLGSAEGQSGLENWGFTRDGLKFTCKVNSSVIWKTSCGALAPITGEVIIDEEDKEHDLSCHFSVDQNGNSVSGDQPCPYGWQVSWTYKNKTNTRIFAY